MMGSQKIGMAYSNTMVCTFNPRVIEDLGFFFLRRGPRVLYRIYLTQPVSFFLQMVRDQELIETQVSGTHGRDCYSRVWHQ